MAMHFIKAQNPLRVYSTFVKTSSIDLSNSSLPKVTGGGPFIELPKFEPLGISGAILSVQLPKSGILNIRTASIVALNGDVSDMETKLNFLNPGIWYQSLRSRSAASVLLSGQHSNFLLLNTVKGENWVFEDADSVVAWSGTDLSITPRIKDGSQQASLHCEGSGSLIVKCSQTLFEVDIYAGEQILVSPSALVASNVPHSAKISLPLVGSFVPLKPLLTLLTKVSQISKFITSHVSNLCKSSMMKLRPELQLLANADQSSMARYLSKLVKFIHSIHNLLQTHLLAHHPLYYVVNGPSRILVTDKPQMNNRF